MTSSLSVTCSIIEIPTNCFFTPLFRINRCQKRRGERRHQKRVKRGRREDREKTPIIRGATCFTDSLQTKRTTKNARQTASVPHQCMHKKTLKTKNQLPVSKSKQHAEKQKPTFIRTVAVCSMCYKRTPQKWFKPGHGARRI